MNSASLRVVAVVAAALLSACPMQPGSDGGTGGGTGAGTANGGGAGGGTGGGTGSVTLAQFCTTYEPTICGFAARCGLFETEMGCTSYFNDGVPDPCGPYNPGLKDGRVTFSATTGAGCLNGLQTGCSFPSECQTSPFVGTLPLDGGCFIEEECGADLFCDLSAMTCPGNCRAAPGSAGAIVPEYNHCKDGLSAEYYTDGGAGFGYRCVSPGTVGQPCTNSCRFGLFCNSDTHQCETERGAGAVCSSADGGVGDDGVCGNLLNCLPDPNAPRFVCTARGGVGAACQPRLRSCRLDLRCESADGGAGTCATLQALGGACSETSECASPNFCKVGLCSAPSGLGGECDTQRRASCTAGLTCNFSFPTDGGFNPEYRCGDAGMTSGACVDPTP